MITYQTFLQSKRVRAVASGLEKVPEIHPVLFPFQADVVEFALQCGRAALFLDTGLGKTVCQLEWARHVPGDVLIAAPLAVAQQTVREAYDKLGLEIDHSRDGTVKGKITITNYERMEHFDLSRFTGIVLDESSCLKGMMTKTTNYLISAFANTPFRLACTATPAPNDYEELGNHSAFLGIMSRDEMLTRWFIHDSANTSEWRIKGHAVQSFWEWVASWAACISSPADLGYNADAYNLPPLITKRHIVDAPIDSFAGRETLFGAESVSATSLHANKRKTLQERVGLVAELVAAEPNEPWLIWCESNDESAALKKALPHFAEVKGSDKIDDKEERLLGFANGDVLGLVSKSTICGFGMNYQHCARICFASLSFSFEQFYQAVRRCWRFGQARPVVVHVVISSDETQVWKAIADKMEKHDQMKHAMRHAIFQRGEVSAVKIDYNPTHRGHLPHWL